MTIYIDTEFDGFRGDLISIALVNDDNKFFYGVLKVQDFQDEWVNANVAPVLFEGDIFKNLMKSSTPPIYTYDQLQGLVWGYLSAHMYEGETIIADWPDDIMYLTSLLTKPGGVGIDLGSIKFAVKNITYTSLHPHNALYDAIAIKEACEKS